MLSEVCFTSNKEKFDLALADANRAIELDPELPLAYLIRGTLSHAMGDRQQGIDDLEKATQLFKAQGDLERYQQAEKILRQMQSMGQADPGAIGILP